MEVTTISEYLINDQIRDKEIRLIGEQGEQLGIMSVRDALNMAKEAGLDLIKIAPTAKPPVCKIADYGKFRYEQIRREKEARKKQKITEIKEIRLTPNIDENDLKTKANQARKFLTHGDKVKATVMFRGREITHQENGRVLCERMTERLAEIANVEKAPKVEGKNMVIIFSPKTSK